jgi:pyridoxamine 5'-phosphate oxidase
MQTESLFLNNLDQTLEYIRQQCSRAIADRKHEFRQIYVATSGDRFPEVRTVILRDFDWAQKTLYFHTDKRSSKYRELFRNPKISVLAYSHKKKVQIRFRGTAFFNHDDEIAIKSWKILSALSQRLYSLQTPGIEVAQPFEEVSADADSNSLNLNEPESGFSNFLSVGVLIHQIEWLFLSPQGHRRALFEFDSAGETRKKSWLST